MARSSRSLLRVLATLDPRLWELVHPNLPLFQPAARLTRRLGDEVFLNPQPLPPRERTLAETVVTARAVAEAVIAAQFAGRDAAESLQEVIDDWCGTQPLVIPWPKKWPHPWPPGEPYPITEEIDQVARGVQAAAAVVFESYATAVQDEQLSASFAELADRLEEAALTLRQG
jgi:hypothetical protein